MTLNGSDLMLFITKDSKLQSVAYATSHSLEVNADTKDVSTKDNGAGRWQNYEIGMQSWTVSSDNLMSDSAENGLSFNDLYDIFLKREPVEVAFALQSNFTDLTTKLDEEWQAPSTGWTPSDNRYHGKAIITSISLTATNGEKASFSCSMQGCGNLMKSNKGIQLASLSGNPVVKVPTATVETAVKK